MKRNALASLALAFATAYAVADNLGTPTKVGSLSRSTDYVYTADEADTLLSARDNVITGIAIDGSGSLAPVNKTVTIPAATAHSAGVVTLDDAASDAMTAAYHHAATPKAVYDALSAARAYTDAATNAGAYTHPAYTARTGKPTADSAPGFGGTITVSQITSDGTGHVTGATDRTITIPSAVATTTSAGLMSAADKTALDALAAGGVTKAAVSAALQAQGITSADNLDDMDALAAQIAKIVAVLEALD